MRSISLGLAVGLASLFSSLAFQPIAEAEVVLVPSNTSGGLITGTNPSFFPTNTSGGLITSTNPSLGYATFFIPTIPPTDELLSSVIQDQPITIPPKPPIIPEAQPLP